MWGKIPGPVVNLSHFDSLRSLVFRIYDSPEEEEREDQLQQLDIVSTCPDRGRREPLQVIIPNETVKLPQLKESSGYWITGTTSNGTNSHGMMCMGTAWVDATQRSNMNLVPVLDT
ncbi:hypothetical protein PM082_022463 [Marasmius tenuissimus]|nr:hypothetical protein PM082_022463 [Marasmius tenuissimus]